MVLRELLSAPLIRKGLVIEFENTITAKAQRTRGSAKKNNSNLKIKMQTNLNALVATNAFTTKPQHEATLSLSKPVDRNFLVRL
jgi:hypothetical protein